MRDYFYNIGVRVRIAMIVGLFVPFMLLAVFTFPVTYCLLGISPDAVANWCLDTSERLKRKLR